MAKKSVLLCAVAGKTKQFLGYVRIELCVFSSFIAAAGYLTYGRMAWDLIFVMLGAFFLCAGAYSFNNLTDKKEDFINRKSVNVYASEDSGMIITALSFLLGFAVVSFLPPRVLAVFSIAALSGIIYSAFRLKKYFLVKNIYTGLSVAQAFLIGASVFAVTPEVITYYVLLSIFIMSESIISDLRDYEGDKALELNTIPVCMGCPFTKRLLFAMLAGYVCFVAFAAQKFLIFLPFIAVMVYFIHGNKASSAHLVGSVSFVFLAAYGLLA